MNAHQEKETARRTESKDRGGVAGVMLLGRIVEQAGVKPEDFVYRFLLTVGNQQEVRDAADNEVLRLTLAVIAEKKHQRAGDDSGAASVSQTIEATKARMRDMFKATDASVEAVADRIRATVAERKVLPSDAILRDVLESVRAERKRIASHHF